ncbi:uncharacterized protein LOC130722747 [Lotus japonicus]|uniref:uncharacterized protein LOC130722747 n=1 Tax=Lotus japonicus TaxID=34305 RepID=UPI00258A2897|nr:uncharacterized protein LOC130722747 [Lotus japonicus]
MPLMRTSGSSHIIIFFMILCIASAITSEETISSAAPRWAKEEACFFEYYPGCHDKSCHQQCSGTRPYTGGRCVCASQCNIGKKCCCYKMSYSSIKGILGIVD